MDIIITKKNQWQYPKKTQIFTDYHITNGIQWIKTDMNVDLSPLRRAAMRTDVFVQLVPHGDLGSAEGVHRRHCDLATVETIYLYTYIYIYIYIYI